MLTAAGLGLLIGVTLTMTGLVRGMMDDAVALIRGTHADLWVVQDDTMGPYAESSTLYDDVARNIAGLPGVAEASNVAYLTVQVRHSGKDVRRASLFSGRTTDCSSPLRSQLLTAKQGSASVIKLEFAALILP